MKPGGHLAISDVVALAKLPEPLRTDWQLYTGCVAGASLVGDLKVMMEHAGFSDIRIVQTARSRETISGWFSGRRAEDYVASASIEAVKPVVGDERNP